MATEDSEDAKDADAEDGETEDAGTEDAEAVCSSGIGSMTRSRKRPPSERQVH